MGEGGPGGGTREGGHVGETRITAAPGGGREEDLGAGGPAGDVVGYALAVGRDEEPAAAGL